MRSISTVIGTSTLLLALACSTSETPTVSQSDTERDLYPEVTADQLEELAEGNNAFAFRMYHELVSGEDNLTFSPWSISSAMAMTYSGARGQTEVEMREAMSFPHDQDVLHTAFNRLSLDLEEHAASESTFTLHQANALWGQTGHDFLPEFLEVLALNYGSGLRQTDFVRDPESSRLEINEWIGEQTGGRIANLIPPGALSTATRLVLSNAVYFNAQWLFPFEESMTMDLPFSPLSGETVRVPTMYITEHFRSAWGDGYSAVELPYRGDRMVMIIIVPDSGVFPEIEQSMSAGFLADLIPRLRDENLHLSLPRFSIDCSFMLEDILSGMGMSSAFGMMADFSGMDGEKTLYISSIVHQAFVSVDENGTEAAAATAVIMEKMNGDSAMEFTVDRPFIYFVLDRSTGSILFMGRVMNPLAELTG